MLFDKCCFFCSLLVLRRFAEEANLRQASTYTAEFLEEMHGRACQDDHRAFSKFQANSLKTILGTDYFDYLIVLLVGLDRSGLVSETIFGRTHEIDERILTSYDAISLTDEFTPILARNSGTFLHNTALNSIEKLFSEFALYRDFAQTFDFYQFGAIAYQVPFRTRQKVVFFLSKGNRANFDCRYTEEELEYVIFPFFLAWLHRLNIIDSLYLKRWLALIEGITLPRFRVLRAFFEQEAQGVKEIAKGLGVSKHGVYRHIEHSFETLLSLNPKLDLSEGSKNRLVEIGKAYSFLGFGPSFLSRKIPRLAAAVKP